MKNSQAGIQSEYDIADIEVLNKQSLFSGFFKINKYTFRHRLFAGGWSEVVER